MAILVLAIGLAFFGAFLSLYVDLILRPHPGFEDSERIATVGVNGGRELFGVPFTLMERMADEMSSVEAVASVASTTVLVGPERAQARAELVSAQFFDGLRPHLVLGRGFRAEDHAVDAEPAVVLSYRLWQSRFNGRSDVIDELIDISWDSSRVYLRAETAGFAGMTTTQVSASAPERETTAFRIVGVMSRSLPGISAADSEFWMPLELGYPLFVSDSVLLKSSAPKTYVRLPAGVSVTAVVTELATRYEGESPEFRLPAGTRLDAIDGIVRDITVHRDAKRQLQMFLTGSVLLALVAAANVSLFLLARAPGRRRELSIRLSVGAPIRRLTRQLATEAGLLVFAAALLGLLASIWLSLFIRGLSLMIEAEWRDVSLLDWRVLSSAGFFLVVLTLLVSLAPIVGLRRAGIAVSGQPLSSRASLAQRLAGTAQLAVAGAIGGAAIAFAWFLAVMMLSDPGYRIDDRYQAQFRLPGAYPGADTSVRAIDIPRRREIIEAISGVSAVTFGRPVPASEEPGVTSIDVPRSDDPSSMIATKRGAIDGRFVDVLGLKLVYGRPLADDEAGVLVNQSFARQVWGREDVVGERIPVGGSFGGGQLPEVIGVLEDLSFGHPAAAISPYVFSRSGADASGSLVIQSTLPVAALQQELDGLTASGALDVSISDIVPLGKARRDQLAPDRARGFLTLTTAALVVLLAAFGYYGTQRYLVAAGRREYAIRAALGASPAAIGRLVILRALQMSLPGLAIGGLLAFIAVAWLSDDYLGGLVSPGVAATVVVALLAVLLLAATVGPARAARRAQPASQLRED